MKWRLKKTTYKKRLESIIELVAAGVLLLCSGCVIGFDADSVTLEGSTCAINGAPMLRLISPTEGQEILCADSCNLRILIETENLCLVENWGMSNVTGEAHVKVFIDGQALIHPASGLDTLAIDNLDVAIWGMNNGPHDLEVLTYNNDGTPHSVLGPVLVSWNKVTVGTPP
jgi:hypothetical protein